MDHAQFHRFTHTLEQTLATDDRVRALVAIGSLAHPERIDSSSDHDFWVITTTAAQTDFLTDLSWLPDHTTIVLALRPAEQYYTVLYADGHIAEFAIFGTHDLERGRLTHYRMLFDKDAITARVQAIAIHVQHERRTSYKANATFGHFLITLCTGAARAARGEQLSAHTYIFQYALDALLTLIIHHRSPQRPALSDPFEPRRRFEHMYPELSPTLIHWLTLPPIVAARQMLDLAEQFLMDGTVALAPQALSTTRAYLQRLEQE